MDKKTIVILAVLGVGLLGLIGISIVQSNSQKVKVDNLAQVIEPSEASGNLPENIEGNPDAPVKIYQYGDYQCTACAPMDPYIVDLIEEYGDDLAVVFRTTIMSYHQNGTAAASAANAAAIQGYWKEYKDLLFANQNDWYYSEADQRQTQFEEYFMKASDTKGDLAKFREDMASSAVRQKIKFDEQLAQQAGVEFTPTFYVEDEFIDQRGDGENQLTTEAFLNLLRQAIDKRLEEKGIKVEKKTDSSEKK